jgi:hypothetical protein
MAGETPATASYQWMLLTHSCRRTRMILDKQGRIVAALVGQPDDPEWGRVINDAVAVLHEVQVVGTESDAFSQKSVDHRRGRFLAIPVGVSFGGGQTVRAGLREMNFSLGFCFINFF